MQIALIDLPTRDDFAISLLLGKNRPNWICKSINSNNITPQYDIYIIDVVNQLAGWSTNRVLQVQTFLSKHIKDKSIILISPAIPVDNDLKNAAQTIIENWKKSGIFVLTRPFTAGKMQEAIEIAEKFAINNFPKDNAKNIGLDNIPVEITPKKNEINRQEYLDELNNLREIRKLKQENIKVANENIQNISDNEITFFATSVFGQITEFDTLSAQDSTIKSTLTSATLIPNFPSNAAPKTEPPAIVFSTTLPPSMAGTVASAGNGSATLISAAKISQSQQTLPEAPQIGGGSLNIDQFLSCSGSAPIAECSVFLENIARWINAGKPFEISLTMLNGLIFNPRDHWVASNTPPSVLKMLCKSRTLVVMCRFLEMPEHIDPAKRAKDRDMKTYPLGDILYSLAKMSECNLQHI